MQEQNVVLQKLKSCMAAPFYIKLNISHGRCLRFELKPMFISEFSTMEEICLLALSRCGLLILFFYKRAWRSLSTWRGQIVSPVSGNYKSPRAVCQGCDYLFAVHLTEMVNALVSAWISSNQHVINWKFRILSCMWLNATQDCPLYTAGKCVAVFCFSILAVSDMFLII